MSRSNSSTNSMALHSASLLFAGLMAIGAGQANADVEAFTAEELASATQNSFVAIGPAEHVDLRRKTISVLGQEFIAGLRTLKSVRVGAYVIAAGELQSHGLVLTELSNARVPYVSGSSEIFLRGVVMGVDRSVGHLFVGGAQIDYTSTLAGGLQHQPEEGSLIEILGTQTSPGAVVTATSVTWAFSISGGDLNSISGGDLNSISGGDAD